MTRSHRFRFPHQRLASALLAAGLLLASSGCPSPAITYRSGYLFTVKFTQATTSAPWCPTDVDVDFRNCLGSRKDCVRGRAGQTVQFVSSPAGNDFRIFFDPFREKHVIESSSGTTKAFKVDNLGLKAGDPSKEFTFSVREASGHPTCPPLDPRIIVDP